MSKYVRIPCNRSSKELLKLKGARINSGSYRTVYEHKFDRSLVIKHQHTPDLRRGNYREISAWKRAVPKVREMLCPIVEHSSDKHVIIMRRAILLPEMDRGSWAYRMRFTKYKIFRDFKEANVGKIDGRLVVIDYGHMHQSRELIDPCEIEEYCNWLDERCQTNKERRQS